MSTDKKENERTTHEESRAMAGESDTDDQCYDMSDTDDCYTDPCCEVFCCCC